MISDKGDRKYVHSAAIVTLSLTQAAIGANFGLAESMREPRPGIVALNLIWRRGANLMMRKKPTRTAWLKSLEPLRADQSAEVRGFGSWDASSGLTTVRE